MIKEGNKNNDFGLPTVVCIGGARCASTWLGHCFINHPRVGWLEGEPRTLSTVFWREGEIGVRNAYAGFKDFAVRGEKDPYYSTLYPEDVKRISELLPALKIIFLVRNPPERTLSHIALMRKRYANGRSSHPMEDLWRMLRFVESPVQTRFNDHGRTLASWTANYPDDAIMVIRHEEIVHEQRTVLKRIAHFVGIDDEGFKSDAAQHKNRLSSKDYRPEKPDFLSYYLARRWQARILTWQHTHDLDLSYWVAQNDRVLRVTPRKTRMLYLPALIFFGYVDGGSRRLVSRLMHWLRQHRMIRRNYSGYPKSR